MTNYVTAQPPKWAENTVLVWSVFAGLAIVSLGLFFWERRLAAEAPDGGARPVPLGRIAVGGHSMNPPAVSAPVRGREAELERIGSLVRGSGGGMVVVCGAGGLGKTTLAAEAAAQARAEGRVVVWIRWRDAPDQLGQDLAQAAHILGLPESRLEEARTGRVSLVDAVWEHLATVTGWLIVVDNVDTPSRVGPGSGLPAAYQGWLRPHGGGVLLVTSRDTTRQTWGPDADLIHLQPLPDDAGGAVLLDAAPHAGTAAAAEALAARLGGLPLGLNAAGTYLSVPTSRHRTFTAYQHALEAEFTDLLGAEHPAAATDPAVARRVVRHTWDLSLDQLHQDGYTLARPVLQLLALLEPATVPRTLMTPELVTDATGLPATAATVDAALAGLHQYGLLHTPETDEPDPDSPTVGRLQLHPLVREVTAHTLNRPEPTGTWLTTLDDHLTRAVNMVAGLPGRTGWPTARLLAPHLPAHLDRSTPDNFSSARDTLADLADTLTNAGAVSEELLLRRRLLDAETDQLGPDHPDTLGSRNNLANALHGLGEHQQAADLHRQTLTDRERVLGPDHPETLGSRHNVANSLDHLGEHRQAADLHRQVIADRERVLGPDHP
ncbi:tetratricopeptide repeat protein, partial [Streptomyces sp. st115]|uniref:tetratricopeptide repeat protein n=1 Tax=Streptomyces sp. st115 TaxID=1828047 RepID=UPI00211D3278